MQPKSRVILALSLTWGNCTLLISAILSDVRDSKRGVDTSTSSCLLDAALDADHWSNDALSSRRCSMACRASRSDNLDHSASSLTWIDLDRDAVMVQKDDRWRAGSVVDMLPRIAMDLPVTAIEESHIASCQARMSSILDSRSAHRSCRSWRDLGVEVAVMLVAVVIII
jgi:hypothetical protein